MEMQVNRGFTWDTHFTCLQIRTIQAAVHSIDLNLSDLPDPDTIGKELHFYMVFGRIL